MQAITVTDFKAHALGIFKKVSDERESVVVTKRGTPIAEVIPYVERNAVAGKLSDALVFEEDVVSPLGEEMWNVCTG